MDIPAIFALIESSVKGVAGLVGIINKLNTGQDPTPEDEALLKQEQAAAEARFDAASGH